MMKIFFFFLVAICIAMVMAVPDGSTGDDLESAASAQWNGRYGGGRYGGGRYGGGRYGGRGGNWGGYHGYRGHNYNHNYNGGWGR